MQVDGFGPDAVVAGVQILDNADIHRLEVLAARIEIVAVQDVHVPTIALATLEIAAGCGVGLRVLGRDDFEEGAAQRPQRVVEAILADAGIAMADLRSEDSGELRLDRLKLARNQTDLAKPQISHGALPGRCRRRDR